MNLLTNPKVVASCPIWGILIFIGSLWDMAKIREIGNKKTLVTQSANSHSRYERCVRTLAAARKLERLRLCPIINRLLSGKKIRLFRFQGLTLVFITPVMRTHHDSVA